MLLQSGKFSIDIPVDHTFLVTLVTSPHPVFLSLSSVTKPSAGKNFGDRSMVHSTVCQSMPQILKLQSGASSRHQMERDAAEKNQNMWPFLTNSYNDVRNTEEHRRNPKLDFYNYVMQLDQPQTKKHRKTAVKNARIPRCQGTSFATRVTSHLRHLLISVATLVAVNDPDIQGTTLNAKTGRQELDKNGIKKSFTQTYSSYSSTWNL